MRTLSGLLGLAAIAAISATPVAAADISSARSAPPAPATVPQAKVELGVLVCNVAPSVGLVLGSVRDLDCELRTSRVQPYGIIGTYKGTISRFGVDIGVINSGTLSWAVFAPSREVGAGVLAGKYYGISANATVALGLGANVLLGGSQNTVALQPLSLEGTSGANIAAGVAELKLEQAPVTARYRK